MSGRKTRLAETFDALAAISRRLALSLSEDSNVFPVDAASASSEDPATMRVLDAFLQRYSQTLDQLLRKLFPRLNAAIIGDDDLLPIRQVLESLHRAGVVESVSAWLELIEVRNRLTHEYALDPASRAAALNEAWDRAPALLAQVERARSYVERHELIGKAP